ncbi:hypothetical protein MLD63_02335 (plasmid) [Paracoccus sp. TK19116]|uniref:DUF998 domain-containing protein n=1 Tax=Paracoccus albicereus TaxID=2922394 RepID=A0ABT1MNY7_9RHOB|nr:hypothetical protein [Paracoccus albicereus]MCQ0969276.1 hypothetical protein [Paracoccus albicereus]
MAEDLGLREKSTNDLVVSFLAVRRSIGILGLFLPVSLIVYGLFSHDGILDSMSAYYYSPMREIFVGTLCALAVFLWTYEGYRPQPGEWLSDRIVAKVASLGAAGVALLPTAPAPIFGAEAAPVIEDQPVTCTLSQCLLGDVTASVVHFLSAAAFFGAMTVFLLFLFTKGAEDSGEKRAANRIYRACGLVILVALVLIGVLQFTGLREALGILRPVFWLEVAASIAIAVGWMTKGDSMRPLQKALAA